jgi:ubiquitin C-terminal hydrolase
LYHHHTDTVMEGKEGLVGTMTDETNTTTSTSCTSPMMNEQQQQQQQQQKYGGLTNLGNTCYMAAALQMLASLDGFVHDLDLENGVIPPPFTRANDDDVAMQTKGSSSHKRLIRDVLVEILYHLSHGESVCPDDLKRCIDDRTGLFGGYRQQDSHEFLTTLLDLIDQEYQQKNQQQQQQDNGPELHTSTTTNTTISTTPTAMVDQEFDADQQSSSSSSSSIINSIPINDKTLLLLKRPRLDGTIIDEPGSCLATNGEDYQQQHLQQPPPFYQSIIVHDNVHDFDSTTNDGHHSSSFINLNYGDIEELLYGQRNVETVSEYKTNTTLTMTGEDRKCKLVGGRMNPLSMELTRCDQTSHHVTRNNNLNNNNHHHLHHDDDDAVAATDVTTTNTTHHQDDSSYTCTCTINHQLPDLETKRYNNNIKNENTSRLTIPPDILTNQSPIDSNFTIQVRVSLTCESCKYRRSHMETFSHLSLEVGSLSCGDNDDGDQNNNDYHHQHHHHHLDDCLRKFFAPERRDIKCEKCFHHCAMQTMEITKLPSALLLHLKRFMVQLSPDYTSISYRKDQSAVSFQEQITLDHEGVLEEFFAPDISLPTSTHTTTTTTTTKSADNYYYAIRSVVNHIGSSVSCGHYITDAKKKRLGFNNNKNNKIGDMDPHDNSSNRVWTRFNDDDVTTISAEEAITKSSHTAYMILYELE